MSENDDEVLAKLMQALTKEITHVLQKIALYNIKGLYASNAVRLVSGGIMKYISEKFPSIASILKILLAYVEKKSLTAQSTSSADTIHKLEADIEQLSGQLLGEKK
jgi:hypothetical protein